jgi:hypothetical protein
MGTGYFLLVVSDGHIVPAPSELRVAAGGSPPLSADLRTAIRYVEECSTLPERCADSPVSVRRKAVPLKYPMKESESLRVYKPRPNAAYDGHNLRHFIHDNALDLFHAP